MAKTLRFLVLVVGLLTLLTAGLQAQSSGLQGSVTQGVWMRVGPGTDWRKLELMPTGTAVAVDGRTEDGAWVRGINSNGTVGWFVARFTTLNAEAVFSLPVIAREAPITVAAPPPGAGAPPPSTENNTESSAPPVAPVEGGITATATANVNMRSGPGTDWRRVGALGFGEQITIDGRDGSVTWVRGINGAGVVGWVFTRYLSLNYDQIAALPVVDPSSPFGLAAPGGGGSTGDTAAPPVDIQPVGSTAPVTGFNLGGHVADWNAEAANWMRVAGMNWVKRQVRYSQGQDASSVAHLINDAHSRGFRILLGVVGHSWELNNGNYYADYSAFVAGLAALGADAIEVWNEPNIDREWPAGQIDPGGYTQLLAQAYNAIKSTNSNTLVISGAPAPTGFFGGCSGGGCDDAFFVSGMAAAGAGNYMDCIGAHYNEGIVGPNQTSGDPRSEHYTRYFWGMVNTYYDAFGGSKPVCFTELGYLSPEGFGPLPGHFGWASETSVGEQALWLDQAVSLSANSGRVLMVIIWNVDFKEYGADPMAGYAIIRPDGNCPACTALGN